MFVVCTSTKKIFIQYLKKILITSSKIAFAIFFAYNLEIKKAQK